MTLDINMRILEGQLSKYTNVMKGWQYRWFVLDPESGVLSYYMLEERGSRERSRLLLPGAVVCPSDEDSHTFSVHSASGQLYRLRASDARQRQHWIDRLRTVVQLHNRVEPEKGVVIGSAADCRLETRANSAVLAGQQPPATLSVLNSLHEANMALRAANHELNCLTRAIRQLPSQVGEQCVTNTDSELLIMRATALTNLLCLEQCYWVLQQRRLAVTASTSRSVDDNYSGSILARAKPEKDFFSDVADWFDTNFGATKLRRAVSDSRSSPRQSTSVPAEPTQTTTEQHEELISNAAKSSTFCDTNLVPDWQPCISNFIQQQTTDTSTCADVRQILSSVKLGGDLTRVSLPAELLRPCSLLETIAQFMSRPALLVAVSQADTALDRMCAVLRWYLAGWTAILDSDAGVGKPYNPVQGETFYCWFDQCPEDTLSFTCDHSASTKGRLRVVCEQVSHHPPVSAVHADGEYCSVQASVSYLVPYNSTSVTIVLSGQISLFLKTDGVTYTCHGFPAVHVRSPLGRARWLELGGHVKFTCSQTDYVATLNFHVQPNSDGERRHRVSGQIRAGDGQTEARLSGQWRGSVNIDCQDRRSLTFNCSGPPGKSWLRPLNAQATHESRQVWAPLTSALADGDMKRAEMEKQRIESAQRPRPGGVARHFYQHDQLWVFKQGTEPVTGTAGDVGTHQ